MTGFFLAFLAVVLAGIGARDQLTVAALSARLGRRLSLLVMAVVLAIATAALAAFAAIAVAPLIDGAARIMLAAMALALAGVELLLPIRQRVPQEPTRSLFAAGLVILALQLTDAARLLAFAIAVATHAPITAGAGAALGGVVVMAAGWAVPERVLDLRLPLLRRSLGALMVLLGAFMALQVLG